MNPAVTLPARAKHMNHASRQFAIIGAGINGLVAANYLLRAGHHVTLLERSHRVGGACVSETANIDGVSQDYALGASTLGLMQDFVWQETGLADRLQIWATSHPDLVWFPGEEQPTRLHSDLSALAQEYAAKWGEEGDVAAFFADEDKVIRFIQDGYRAGRPPSMEETVSVLGDELTALWITGTARNLLDHYFTSERTKVQMAMDVSESGPVSIDEPCSAFILPMMASGSVFSGGSYGYVKGGIWQITQKLSQINQELGAKLELSCTVHEVDPVNGTIRYETADGSKLLQADHVVFATDPQTAARLTGEPGMIEHTENEQVLGTSGKLNLMFRKPVRWKDDAGEPESETAFRYFFAVDNLKDYEKSTFAVTKGADFSPGYFQVYCEGASMRRMGMDEPFERLAVFFKNLGLRVSGDELPAVEAEVKSTILSYIANPEDCVWSRMLTPADLKHEFGFPGGNLEHTMLVAGQCYFDRNYADEPGKRFYQFGAFENVSICGSSTYPCGSVAGTPAYMCVKELLPLLENR